MSFFNLVLVLQVETVLLPPSPLLAGVYHKSEFVLTAAILLVDMPWPPSFDLL